MNEYFEKFFDILKLNKIIFTFLVNLGNSYAQFNLGLIYDIEGRDIPKNYQKEMMWYRKAADQGDSHAQNNIGSMYDEGRGVLQDYKEAMLWYRKAADQGHSDAQYNLGLMYNEGKGIPQDLKEAAHWYLKAANQEDSDAQHLLGVMYSEGKGVPKTIYMHSCGLALQRHKGMKMPSKIVIASSNV